MIKWGWLKASHPPNTFARTTSNSHPQGDSQKPYWIMHLVSRKYSYKIPLIPRNQENMGKKRWGQNLLYHSVDFIVKAGNSLVEVFTCVHVCTYVYVFRPMFVHLLIILILKEELQAQSTTWFTNPLIFAIELVWVGVCVWGYQGGAILSKYLLKHIDYTPKLGIEVQILN